jgi:aminopeptidase
MIENFDAKLAQYADILVDIGLNIHPGQKLLIRLAPLEAAPLVRLIAEKAYKKGASLVDVMWADDELILDRFNHAPRDSFEEYPAWKSKGFFEVVQGGGASLAFLATDPDLLKGQNPDLVGLAQKVAWQQIKAAWDHINHHPINWLVASYPLESWARMVFPDQPESEQLDLLWDAIFQVCRINEVDPVAAWGTHLAELAARAAYMTEKAYASLKYTAPGTDLVIGLPKDHLWAGGQKDTEAGFPFTANIPTEEIFTLPHREQAEGVVSATMPLSNAGTLIEGIRLTFENGRVVKAEAEKNQEVLQKVIESDEGASRLGEVALVPHSSAISQSGILFYNTLFDENASCHLALGSAYHDMMKGGAKMDEEEFAAAGGNDSLIHVDFMIGSDQMDIDGITAAGKAEPVLRAGEWAFEL